MNEENAERWKQIKAHLHQYLDLPSEERSAFLNQLRRDNPTLFRQVEIALPANGEGEVSIAPSLVGQSIGSYVLIDTLGYGGMGDVYLAERADGAFKLRVALKLIRCGMNSKSASRRFLAERQILAQLQHNNIAQLLDGGMSETEQPYFVMEYINGTHITTYCDDLRLDLKTRLGLFLQVCRAVQYAHRNLVVHRDLKPSNILVTPASAATGSEAQVKLLDFGIAKVLSEAEAAEETTSTRTGQAVMTPEYASPEQVRGEAITTATDVYTLGVLLYELLTGHRPYQLRSRSPAELERVICGVEPVRPSTMVVQTQERYRRDGSKEMITPESVSQARGLSVEKLRQRLSGDLDTMVLKALRKEPDRRYASAEAFHEDVRRHLSGLPVSAQADSLGYRIRKFAGRHRVGVSAAGAVAVLLAVMVIMLVQRAWQADQIRREARKLETVQAFLVGLFEVSDPDHVEPRDITASELLDRGIAHMETLGEEPEIQAAMMHVLGVVHREMGLYEEADSLLKQALALRRKVYGKGHVEVVNSLNDLATLLWKRGSYDEAERLYQEALTMGRNLLGDEHVDIAESMDGLAIVWEKKGRYDDAEQLHRDALAIQRKQLGDEHEDIARSLNNLAIVLSKNGRLEEAESFHRKALAMWRTLHGNEHPNIARSLNALAVVLEKKGDYDQAEQIHREALAMRKKLLGDEHPLVALDMDNLALALGQKGAYEEAERLNREALSLWRKLVGPDHPDVATSLNNLAITLYHKGAYDEAERLTQEALTMRQMLLGHEHPDVATSFNNLAIILEKKDRYDEAEQLHRQALAIQRKLLGDDHPDVVFSLSNLASLLNIKRAYDEADPVHREIIALRKNSLGPEDPLVALAMNNLGTVMYQQGEYDEADSLFRTAMALWRKRYGPEHVDITYSLYWLGRVHHAKGNYAEAEQSYREALAMRRKLMGDKHAAVSANMHHLGALLIDRGRASEAEPMLRQALSIRQDSFGAAAEETVATKRLLGSCLVRLGKHREAEPLLLDSDRFYQKKPATWRPEKEQVRKALYDLYTAWGKPEQAAPYRDQTP